MSLAAYFKSIGSDPRQPTNGPNRIGSGQLTARWLAAAFVVYGLVATAFLAINVPPFQIPDETNHFQRAAQVADGGLIGERLTTESGRFMAGGRVDPAILEAAAPFADALRYHPEARATRAYWTPDHYWSDTRVMENFANTAVYPPWSYVPSAIGVLTGKAAGMTVLQTLIVSRLLTGAVAVAIGAAAIVCAGGAAVWLFAILTLPMSMLLMASASQDALLLACSALAGALFVRALRSPNWRSGMALVGLVLLLSLVSMARPAYAAFALLPIALSSVTRRVLAAAIIFASAVIWAAVAAAYASSNYGGFVGADAIEQVARLLNDPLLGVHVAVGTFGQFWHFSIIGFIGILGWNETELPQAYYFSSITVIGIAAIASMLDAGAARINIRQSSVIALSLLLSWIGIALLLYIIWTAPGRTEVDGISGRYYIPLALIGTGLLPALGRERSA